MMSLLSPFIERARLVLILILVLGMVLFDSINHLMSMVFDGAIAVALLVLLWPKIRQ